MQPFQVLPAWGVGWGGSVFKLKCVPQKSPVGRGPLGQQSRGPDSLRLHQKGDSAAPHKIMEDHPGKYRRCISGDKRVSRSAALIITKPHTFEREGKNSKEHLMDSVGRAFSV